MSEREVEVLIQGALGGGALALIILVIVWVVSFVGKTIDKGKARLKNTNTVEDDIIFTQITEELKRRDINEALMTKLMMQAKGDIDKAEAEYIRVRRIEIAEQIRKQNQIVLDLKKKKEKKDGCLLSLIQLMIFALIVFGIVLFFASRQ